MNRRAVLAALPLLALPATPRAQQTRGAPAPPIALPAGMSPLPQGAWRLAFRAGQAELPAGVAPTLAEIGRRLADRPAGTGRITVEAQASGPANDASAARRLSLARATAVRAALVAGGLEETRVDLRPLGRTPQALDCADILPPGLQARAQTR
jgi:outer membrane protein OmpA-like peptidoglycan-associated protein